MPIYEYRCQNCRRVSSFLLLNLKDPFVPVCKQCGSHSLERILSRVHVRLSEETRLERLADPAGLRREAGRAVRRELYSVVRRRRASVERNPSRHGCRCGCCRCGSQGSARRVGSRRRGLARTERHQQRGDQQPPWPESPKQSLRQLFRVRGISGSVQGNLERSNLGTGGCTSSMPDRSAGSGAGRANLVNGGQSKRNRCK